MKPQYVKITRYFTARLVGFAWNKVAPVSVGVCALNKRVFNFSTATEGLNVCSLFLIAAKL